MGKLAVSATGLNPFQGLWIRRGKGHFSGSKQCILILIDTITQLKMSKLPSVYNKSVMKVISELVLRTN